MTWQELKDACRKFGDCTHTEIAEQSGRSLGWGLAKFSDMRSAQACIGATAIVTAAAAIAGPPEPRADDSSRPGLREHRSWHERRRDGRPPARGALLQQVSLHALRWWQRSLRTLGGF